MINHLCAIYIIYGYIWTIWIDVDMNGLSLFLSCFPWWWFPAKGDLLFVVICLLFRVPGMQHYIPVHACMFEPHSVQIVGNNLLLPSTTNRDLQCLAIKKRSCWNCGPEISGNIEQEKMPCGGAKKHLLCQKGSACAKVKSHNSHRDSATNRNPWRTWLLLDSVYHLDRR